MSHAARNVRADPRQRERTGGRRAAESLRSASGDPCRHASQVGAPAATLAYAEAFDGKRAESDAHDTGLRDAAKAWAPDFGLGERDGDAYLARLFGDADLTERVDFVAHARRVWMPFVAARVLRGDA